MAENKLKIKLSKCRFLERRIEFLEYPIENGKVYPGGCRYGKAKAHTYASQMEWGRSYFRNLKRLWKASFKIVPAAFNNLDSIPSFPSLLLFFSLWIGKSTFDLNDGGTSPLFLARRTTVSQSAFSLASPI